MNKFDKLRTQIRTLSEQLDAMDVVTEPDRAQQETQYFTYLRDKLQGIGENPDVISMQAIQEYSDTELSKRIANASRKPPASKFDPNALNAAANQRTEKANPDSYAKDKAEHEAMIERDAAADKAIFLKEIAEKAEQAERSERMKEKQVERESQKPLPPVRKTSLRKSPKPDRSHFQLMPQNKTSSAYFQFELPENCKDIKIDMGRGFHARLSDWCFPVHQFCKITNTDLIILLNAFSIDQKRDMYQLLRYDSPLASQRKREVERCFKTFENFLIEQALSIDTSIKPTLKDL